MKTPLCIEGALGITAVERDTGIAKDTLRVWERRYGFPAPARDANGERLYPPEQVERLRLVRRLIDQGRRPSQVVAADADTLQALLAESCPRDAAPPEAGPETELLRYVRLRHHVELAAALRQLLMKQGLQRFAAETVAPLSEAVGEAWLRGEIDVGEEHLYTEQVQNVLRSAIGTHTNSAGRPRILLTTFPDEHHVLGLLMAEATLAPEGAHCVSLGTRTPLTDIRQAAAGGGFDIVGLSFSAAYPQRLAIDGLLELRAALPADIALWAGGAALKGRQRRLPGIRVVDSLDDTLAALREWRDAHER